MQVLLFLTFAIIADAARLECNLNTSLKFKYRKFWSFEDLQLGESKTVGTIEIGENNTEVVLYDGHTEVLCKAFLKPFKKTRNLRVENLDIQTLEEGAFTEFSQLEYLQILDNIIFEIPTRVFDKLSTVKALFLDDNGIQHIAEGAFDDMPKLVILSLSHNRLSTITPEWFRAKPLLRLLNLDNNRIRSLNCGDFKLLEGTETMYLNGLYLQIALNNNWMTSVSNRTFEGLHYISGLTLSYNELTEMPIFENVKIRDLNLEYNRISHVYESELLKGYKQVNSTFLYGNPLTRRALDHLDHFSKEHGLRFYYDILAEAHWNSVQMPSADDEDE